ncbi:hypothetical protein GCM10007276_32540 [Agaricicola taiwanensis]|uniref:Uncharacterized protein n=1 Tax=Agaricicola taiwanensis TaxID=591372 RepID=A0A8J2YMS4_9RHOB|nr:hypothetical protein [Agaricicola taiwanensis]GGE53004.1 hypothetical protein GCM10007276_32540 [Agaricicola taiwanensis]
MAHKTKNDYKEAPTGVMRDRSHAAVELKVGPVALRAEADSTPAGLLAVGGLVSGILLSVAVVVWSSTRKLRDDIDPYARKR